MSPSSQSVRSLAEKRVRRQKIFIAVGSIALLAILGFELPKIMGGKNGQSAAPGVSTSAAGVAVAPVMAPGQLPGTDRVIVQRDSNQLISFGLFKSKDPFVQQLTTDATATTPAPTPAPATPTATEPTPGSVPPAVVPSSTTPSSPSVAPPGTPTPSSTTPTAPAPIPTQALIATNGVCESVAVNGTFPATENIFRLASIAKDGKSVEIGIVGGSFDSGKPTATLKVGGKLTLVNTADGTRYVIELKSKCANIATSGTTTTASTTPASTTPVAPAPASTTPAATTTDTVTTPIVTDSLDTTPTTTTPSS